MKCNFIFLTILMCITYKTYGHINIRGKILDSTNKQTLSNAYISILNIENRATYSDQYGFFEFKSTPSGIYYLQTVLMGYKTRVDTLKINNENIVLSLYLQETIIELPSVIITARKEFAQNTINSLDFKYRTHSTTQNLLLLVPGLFIAQHAGGGKAEQIFLRGFDVDHGTDVAIAVDGMPVNMVSHAHGQGYADLHFVIPETVDNINFSKGSYDAKTGDFNTAGAVKFQTKKFIRNNILKYETGRFGTQRGFAIINLIPHHDITQNKHSAYIASEYFYTKGYFQNPQNFNRINIFGKYDGQISNHANLSVSISTFLSKWNASGQIPQRAVDNKSISWFGSIDPTEGGNTSRSNLNATLTNHLHNLATIKNQLYLTDYNFELFSNFTYYKEDTINGDQIKQYEKRQLFGYNGSYNNDFKIRNLQIKGSTGLGFRGDIINDIGLASTFQKYTIKDKKKGKIVENNFNGYIDATLLFTEKISINIGIRYDYFTFQYRNKLIDTNVFNTYKGIASPKFNLYYKIRQQIQLYLSAGSGFHSNDARVSVLKNNNTSLPSAQSIDLGTNFKLKKKIFINLAVWYMYLQSEYIYVGDDGLLELSGRTNRIGIDLSARYQMLKWLFIDADLNFAHARFIDLPKGVNYITLAPKITSIGGFGINIKKAFDGSLRYRHLSKRPAIEDYSVVASGYFIVDAVVNYQWKNIRFNLSAENIFNKKWREAQFGTESKLKGESNSITEIHFTPGTPFFIKGGITFLF